MLEQHNNKNYPRRHWVMANRHYHLHSIFFINCQENGGYCRGIVSKNLDILQVSFRTNGNNSGIPGQEKTPSKACLHVDAFMLTSYSAETSTILCHLYLNYIIILRAYANASLVSAQAGAGSYQADQVGVLHEDKEYMLMHPQYLHRQVLVADQVGMLHEDKDR